MLVVRRASSLKALIFGWRAATLTGCLVAGVAIVRAPAIAWGMIGALFGVLLLQFPVYAWVSAAVLAAMLSRLAVATGVVPALINFFHFPLTLGAVLVAVTGGTPQHSLGRPLGIGVGGLLVLSLVSWAFNGGEWFRPVLSWLVFLEPFLLLYALLKVPPPPGKAQLLWWLPLGVPFLQVPLALWQAIPRGVGDHVQGTFLGMGAGHHAAGAVALTGTLICTAKGLSAPAFNVRLKWLLAGMLLCMVPVLADAKQNIAAFLPALLVLLSTFAQFRKSIMRIFITLPIFAAALWIASSYYPPLQRLTDRTVIDNALQAKGQSLTITAQWLSKTPWGWLIGVGPGNSVSRVALMGIERYLNPNSPVALLGLSAAPLTREIWGMEMVGGSLGKSSVMKGTYSWAGLFGDLGLIGLGLYLGLTWKIWRHLRVRRTWQADAARAALIMAGLSGVIFSWLEEPGYMLIVAPLVGLGLLTGEEKDAAAKRLARPQYLPAGWR
jgi:hypothetical protein